MCDGRNLIGSGAGRGHDASKVDDHGELEWGAQAKSEIDADMVVIAEAIIERRSGAFEPANSVVLSAFVKPRPADIAPWLQARSYGNRRHRGTSPPSASVAVVIRYPRGRCNPASRAFAGEPDVVGRATGLCRVSGRAGYLDRRLTLVTRDRFHPNADDLEIVGRVHAHLAIGWRSR